VIGERILRAIPGMGSIARVVRHEHERWDGEGYPDKLIGEQIPLGARIILACDAYHAMVSDRPYRKAIGHRAAMSELTDNALSFETGGSWTHANQEFCPCDYAFIVDRDYYNFKRADILHTDGNGSLSTTSMPMSLDWAIRDKGSLPWTCAAAASAPEYACKSVHSECVDSKNGPGYICNCTAGYEGNAYVVNGCTGKLTFASEFCY
jgi:hypothetical protein